MYNFAVGWRPSALSQEGTYSRSRGTEMNTVVAMRSKCLVSNSSKPVQKTRSCSFQGPRRVAVRPDGHKWHGRQRVRADASADTTPASSSASEAATDLASSSSNGAKSPTDISSNGKNSFDISTLAVHAGTGIDANWEMG